MRILIVGPSITRSKGGMATVIKDQLSNSLLNNQNKLTYLISHVDGNIFEKVYYSLKSVLHIIFNQRKYDIIHFHTAADASFFRKSLLLRIGKLFNKKTIIHMHGSDFDSFYKKKSAPIKKYIVSTVNLADKVLVLSEYWRLFFESEFPNSNVSILKNGINVQSFEESVNVSKDFENYLFLGRFGERKGIYDLLKAIKQIANSSDKNNLKFYLAGDGEIDKVKKLIEEYYLEANVELLGWINDKEKKRILNKVQVVILPSYDEGLPMALIEAMACGKVIISTYAGGIPDLVKQNYNGFLFNAGDINQLVDYIHFVNQNPSAMQLISKNNIQTIYENFNLDNLAVQLNEIYNTI